jgi:hypothetical protein
MSLSIRAACRAEFVDFQLVDFNVSAIAAPGHQPCEP